MRSYWVRVGLKSNRTGIQLEKEVTHKDTNTERPWQTEAEIGVMQPQAKDCWVPPEAGRHGPLLPSEPPEGANPAHTLISDVWPPEPWKKKFLLFSATYFAVRYFVGPRKLIQASSSFFAVL